MVTFSIIIPTFNSEKTLDAALKSVLQQTFSDFEILIIDGISKDNTLRIVESYKDERVKVWSEKDNGIYDAMNKGIKKANGEWVYFLGSDDILYNKDILAVVNTEITNSNPNPDLIYGNVQLKYQNLIYDGEFSIDKLLFTGNICQQAIFYKRELFYKLGFFNLKYKQLADWDYNIRCFKNTALVISYINNVVAVYNEKDGISSTEYDIEFLKEIPYHYDRREQYIDELENKIKLITTSRSFKLANALLYPWRKIKGLFVF